MFDMPANPDGEVKWVLYIVDHFSKISSSIAPRSKHAAKVAEKLALWMIDLVCPYSAIMAQNSKILYFYDQKDMELKD